MSPKDDLDFAIQRIEGLTGYVIDAKDAGLILHKSYECDSIVIVQDWYVLRHGYIKDQNADYMEKDERWRMKNIQENEVFTVVHEYLKGSNKTILHFRPMCFINGGEYDWMFYNNDTCFCVIDIETGIIALYIYLD